MKVALVHDYLNEFGGAERVLLALSKMYPDAPIYTIYYKKNSACGKEFADKNIVQSWFSWIPFSHKLISPFRFMIPFIWATFDFSDYDLVITSSAWAITRGMKHGDFTKEICYLHTPPRYLYGYDSSRNWKNEWFAGLVKFYSLIVNHFMRMYDFAQAQKPDYYIANSKNVGKRLEKFYRRKDYTVVYPPINPPHSTSYTSHSTYFLAGGRMVNAKNFEVIIKAFNKSKKKLIIFGTGVQESYLKSLVSSPRKRGSIQIEFVGRVSDTKLARLYANALGFIVAQKDEDFGMTPLEAASYGTPTIAYKAEGYLESVIDGKTGVFFDELTADSINIAIKKSEKIKWNKTAIKNHAKKFSREEFEKGITEVTKTILEGTENEKSK